MDIFVSLMFLLLGGVSWFIFVAIKTSRHTTEIANLRLEVEGLHEGLHRRIRNLENALQQTQTAAQAAPAAALKISAPALETPAPAEATRESIFEPQKETVPASESIFAEAEEPIASEPQLLTPREEMLHEPADIPLLAARSGEPLAPADDGVESLPPQPALDHGFSAASASVEPEPAFEPSFSGPSLGDRMKAKLASEELEALVGGSWLNKLGVFVLVIGIALFLGYSFTQFGPAGRVSIGVGLSTAMLAGGVWLEQKERYRTFSRGLIGGGWAALFFTTYAMHAVEAAKVMDSAVAGTVMLFAVSVGMIAHSLRYRSQTVTGLAYFLAFVTLLTAEVTPLSVVALIPLAGSLLYVAHRFRWSRMALFGLLATYGVCASRGDTGAPVWQAQMVFSIYWLLFELFDLLRASEKPPADEQDFITLESALLPLNALCFSALSWVKWSAAAPDRLYLLASGIGAAYLAGALLRAWLRPPSSFPAETGLFERAGAGGYEGPVTLTAAFCGLAILLRFDGPAATAGLLLEAQMFFVAGLWCKQRYLRHVAGAMFGAAFTKLVGSDVARGEISNTTSWNAYSWTPVAILAGALCYLNRNLHESSKLYGYAASAVLALAIGAETPLRYLGLAWFLFAGVLFAFGWTFRLYEFRVQGYGVAVLALGATAFRQISIAQGQADPSQYAWIALLAGAILSYAAVLCGLWSPEDRLTAAERAELPRLGSWAVTAHLATLVWRLAPDYCVGVGWLMLAVVLLHLGLRELPHEFRMQSYVMAGLGSVAVLVQIILPIHNEGPLMARLPAILAAVALYLFAARAYAASKSGELEHETLAAVTFASTIGTFFLMAGIWALVPPVLVAPLWALLAILLAETGYALALPALRAQANIVVAAAGVRLFFANFSLEGVSGPASLRLLTVLPVIASYYYQWSRLKGESPRLRDWEQLLGRWYLHAGACLIVVLLRFEMGRAPVALAWALLALALLIMGIRWNNIDLRLESVVIALLASWRGFTTDFYAPESFTGLTGRIATAAIVIGCFYASEFLVPRRYEEEPGPERHLRTFYSLLATLLLTMHLFREVSGSLLTLAWGAEGAILLAAGFTLRERTLRLSALTLLLVCVLKLFLFDLRQLETMYRILSFIVLGLILVAVSWIYTRFRERVHKFL